MIETLRADVRFAGRMLHAGATTSSDDLRELPEVPERAWQLGTRAAISTVFTAGGVTYALSFGSVEPTLKPFGKQDHIYVQVLAAFFATHYRSAGKSAPKAAS